MMKRAKICVESTRKVQHQDQESTRKVQRQDQESQGKYSAETRKVRGTYKESAAPRPGKYKESTAPVLPVQRCRGCRGCRSSLASSLPWHCSIVVAKYSSCFCDLMLADILGSKVRITLHTYPFIQVLPVLVLYY